MPSNNYIITSKGSFLDNEELYHHGIKGMKWGVRKAQNDGDIGFKRKVSKSLNDAKNQSKKLVTKAKREIRKRSNGELAKRGKSALDVLINGDTDWMGDHHYSDSAIEEARNRGKAAIERLMYSQDQIDNKKFFGRYDF